MLLVYTGSKIKEHVGGYSFKRGRPRDVREPIPESIAAHPDIREASKKDVAKAKPDVEIVLDTPDYEPLPGHSIPTVRKVAKKAGTKK